MLKLSKKNLLHLKQNGVPTPHEGLFALQEKVLQFGTGVLLRGLPDYLIDNANRQGVFNGRVVIVKSTAKGSVSAFDEQDNLYTVHVRGIDQGEPIKEDVICSSISRVISATDNWADVLQTAHNPAMQIVISNTTEVGIQLLEEYILEGTPKAFPGKLLAFLYERFRVLGGTNATGMVIMPTELIVNNGQALKSILSELAKFNNLSNAFIEWLTQCNHFCNTLVDRIVPGEPGGDKLLDLEQRSGYTDELRITAEPYYLWAIEGGAVIRNILSFARVNPGVIITEDIEIYRELKLRLLNGTHTLTCALAILWGFTTVKQAMQNPLFSAFISGLMELEIAPSIPYAIDTETTGVFIQQVTDRFLNPDIEHQWVSISAHYSLKLKMRVVPLLLNHYKLFNHDPQYIAVGFAAFILLMNVSRIDGSYFAQANECRFEITDNNAAHFYQAWLKDDPKQTVHNILAQTELWGTDLTLLPGFENAVHLYLMQILAHKPAAVIKNLTKN